MVAPFLAPILKVLASNGLGMLAGAIAAKGKEVIEEKIGIKIPDSVEQLTPEVIKELKIKEIDHEEFLINAQIRRAEITLEAESKASQEVTKRWEADMLSDSYLSKNIRPLSLVAVLGMIFLFAVLAIFGMATPEVYVQLLKELALIMVGAYFVGRSVEKGIDLYQGWKQTKGE